MKNRLTFQDQLTQKYMSLNLLHIQHRKSHYPQYKLENKRRRTLTSVVSEKQIYQQNRKLVEKIIEVNYNPAYVKKMYMGEDQAVNKKRRLSNVKVHRSLEKCSSLKMRQVEEENKRLKKTIDCIKESKRNFVLPPI